LALLISGGDNGIMIYEWKNKTKPSAKLFWPEASLNNPVQVDLKSAFNQYAKRQTSNNGNFS